jgi:hypothetical protein
MLIDGLGVVFDSSSQRLLELGAVKVDEENRLNWKMVGNLILDSRELLNRVSVLLDRILLTISLVLEHSPDTSLVPHVLQLTQLLRGLPMSSIVLHSRSYFINTLEDLLDLGLDLLVGGDSLLIRVPELYRRQLEALLPPVILLFLSIILVIVAWLKIKLLKGSVSVGAHLVNDVDLLLVLSNNLLPLISEYLLDSLDDAGNLDDFPHELLKLNLEDFVSRFVDNNPFVSLTKDGVDSEDGKEVLVILRLVSKDMLTEGD